MTVLDRDDRLRLENRTGKTIVITGYSGEPYARIKTRSIALNRRSPATWLNDDRYARASVPGSANPKLPPSWIEFEYDRAFEWHDHRVHWMSPIPPPKIRAQPDRPQRVFDRRIEGTADGDQFSILGTLNYVPPAKGTRVPLLAIVLPVALGLGVLASLLVLRLRISRRSRRAASTVGGASTPRE